MINIARNEDEVITAPDIDAYEMRRKLGLYSPTKFYWFKFRCWLACRLLNLSRMVHP